MNEYELKNNRKQILDSNILHHGGADIHKRAKERGERRHDKEKRKEQGQEKKKKKKALASRLHVISVMMLFWPFGLWHLA